MILRWVWAALAFAGAVFLHLRGKQKARGQNLEDYAKLRERMDNAQAVDSVDAAREWLRDRAQGRR